MQSAQHPLGQSSLQTWQSRALPYYFYAIGVLAAVCAAALLVLMEVQGNNHFTANSVDEAPASSN